MKITRPYWYLRLLEITAFCLMVAMVILPHLGSIKSIMDVVAILEIAAKDTGVITAVATVISAVFLYLAWKQAKYASDDSERPYVSIMIRLLPDTNRVLVISNTGRSVALNVKLRLKGVKEGLDVLSPRNSDGIELRLIDNPLFTDQCDLFAGWTYEFLLQHGSEYATDVDEMRYPRRFSIDVSFESLNGTTFSYTIPIDINSHRHSIVPKRSTAGQIELNSKEWLPVMKEVRNEIRRISEYLSRLSLGSHDDNDASN